MKNYKTGFQYRNRTMKKLKKTVLYAMTKYNNQGKITQIFANAKLVIMFYTNNVWTFGCKNPHTQIVLIVGQTAGKITKNNQKKK